MIVDIFQDAKTSFNQAVLGTNNHSFFRTYEWGQFKRNFGFNPVYINISDKGKLLPLLLLGRNIPLLGTIYYIPAGPISDKDDFNLANVTDSLVKFLQEYDSRAFLLKIEPLLLDIASNKTILKKAGYKKARVNLQPSSTIILDIKSGYDKWLCGLKQKTRYNINLAKRKGVEIRLVEPTPENMDIIYGLMQSMQAKKKVFLRPKKYFSLLYKQFIKSGLGTLLMAYYQGQPLAMEFLCHFGHLSTYKDGASIDNHRNTMMAYLLQSEAINISIQKGCTHYDMFGSTTKKEVDNTNNNFYGITKFKTNFSNDITEYVGCYDMALKLKQKTIWDKIEPYYLKIYQKLKKDLFW